MSTNIGTIENIFKSSTKCEVQISLNFSKVQTSYYVQHRSGYSIQLLHITTTCQQIVQKSIYLSNLFLTVQAIIAFLQRFVFVNLNKNLFCISVNRTRHERIDVILIGPDVTVRLYNIMFNEDNVQNGHILSS